MAEEIISKLQIRNATKEEYLTFIMPLTRAEEWNLSDDDVELNYSVDPEGYFLAILDGKPVACMSLAILSDAFAGIGYVICLPEYRNKGIVRALITRAIELKQRPGMVVGLEGAPLAYKMYEKFGFETACIVQVYKGFAKYQEPNQEGLVIESLKVQEVAQELFAYDKKTTFFNRQLLFQNLYKLKNLNGIVARKNGKIVGWAILRECDIRPRISPLYADSLDIATQILINLVSRLEPGREFEFYVPEQNMKTIEENWKPLYAIEKFWNTYRMYKDQYSIVSDFSHVFSQFDLTTFF